MEILFMVFMVIVSVMALFAVLVVLRDIVQEILLARREREKASANADVIAAAEKIVAEAEAKQAQTVEKEPVKTAAVEEVKAEEAKAEAATDEAVAEEVKAEEVADEAVAETVTDETAAEEPTEDAPEAKVDEDADAQAADAGVEMVVDEDGKISFSTRQKQTLEEKYLALTSEQRGWYDEIIKYAANQEGSKRFKNERYEEYKVGNSRLVRLLIKRGVINCEFILHNSDFKNYINENKISVKQSATVMLVENAATVDAVKNSIDIVVAAIAEEREYKKKLARERRKAARAAGKAEDGASDSSASAPKDETPAGV